MSLELIKIKRTHPLLLRDMSAHYSQPKGFVGRNICYGIMFNDTYYGSIVGGSATLHLVGRNDFFNNDFELTNVCNNIFYHLNRVDGNYPLRNFSLKVLEQFRNKIISDWENKYGSKLIGFETLVELPRKGETYIRDNWTLVGETKGYTCKREAGKGTDNWTGKRVWNTSILKPKLVFCRKV